MEEVIRQRGMQAEVCRQGKGHGRIDQPGTDAGRGGAWEEWGKSITGWVVFHFAYC